MVRRSLYKRPRPPARDKGVFENLVRNSVCKSAPNGCLDANAGEVVRAIYAICIEAGVDVGRGCGYDALKDEYTVVGKSRHTGKAQDFKVKGFDVAELIHLCRRLNGGPMIHGKLTEQLNQTIT
jgi:hypothetical protein